MTTSLNDISQFTDAVLEVDHPVEEVHGTFDALLDIWNEVLVAQVDKSIDTLLRTAEKGAEIDPKEVVKTLNQQGGLSNIISNLMDNLWSKAMYWGLKDGESEFIEPVEFSRSLEFIEFAKKRNKAAIQKDLSRLNREFRAATKQVELAQDLRDRLVQQRIELISSEVQDEERLMQLEDSLDLVEQEIQELTIKQQEAQMAQLRGAQELQQYNEELTAQKAQKALTQAESTNKSSLSNSANIKKLQAEKAKRDLEDQRKRAEAAKQKREYEEAARNRREQKVPLYLRQRDAAAKARVAPEGYDRAFKRVIATDAREEFNTIDNIYTALNRKSEFSAVYLERRKSKDSTYLSDAVQGRLREEVAEYLRQQDPAYAAQGIMKGIKSSAGTALSNERGTREGIVREALKDAFQKSSPGSKLKKPVYGSEQKNRLLTTKTAQTDLFRDINAKLTRADALTQEEKVTITAALTRAQKRGNLEDVLKTTIREYQVGKTPSYSIVNNIMNSKKESYNYANSLQLNNKITQIRDGQQAGIDRVRPILERYGVDSYQGLTDRQIREEEELLEEVREYFPRLNDADTLESRLRGVNRRINNLKTTPPEETSSEREVRYRELEKILRQELGFLPDSPDASPQQRRENMRARLAATGQAQRLIQQSLESETLGRYKRLSNDIERVDQLVQTDESQRVEVDSDYRNLRDQINQGQVGIRDKGRRLTALKTQAATFPKGSPERAEIMQQVNALERERFAQKTQVRGLKESLIPETKYLQGLETVRRTQRADFGKLQDELGMRSNTEDIETGVVNFEQDLDRETRELDAAKVPKRDPRRREVERRRVLLDKYKAKQYRVNPRAQDTVTLTADELTEVQRANPDIEVGNGGKVKWEDLRHARDSQRKSAGSYSANYAATLVSTEISAAYNLGRLQAYISKGVKFVQYISADDPRVSVFCRSLDKVIFKITDFAQVGMRTIPEGENLPNFYIGRQPFPNTRIPHYAPPNNSMVAVNDMGVGIWFPPSHLNCRSYLKPIYKDDDQKEEERANKRQLAKEGVSKKDQAIILKRLKAGQLTEAEATQLLVQQTSNRTRLEKMSKWLLKRKQGELRQRINEILGKELDLSDVDAVTKILNIDGLRDELTDVQYEMITELRGDKRNEIVDVLFAAERKFKKAVNNKTIQNIGFLTQMVTDAGLFMQQYLDRKQKAAIKKDPAKMDAIISAAILGGAGALGMGGALYFLSKSNLMNELDEYVQDNIPEIIKLGEDGLQLSKSKVQEVLKELKESLPPSMVKLLEDRSIPFLPEPAMLETLETRQGAMLEAINAGVSSNDFGTLQQYVGNYDTDELPAQVVKTKVVEALNKELTAVSRDLTEELQSAYQTVFSNKAGPIDLNSIQRVDTDVYIGYRVYVDKGRPLMVSKKNLANEIPRLAQIRSQAEDYLNAIDDLLRTTSASNPGYSDLVANRRILAEIQRNTNLEENLASLPKGTLKEGARKLSRMQESPQSLERVLTEFNNEYSLAEEEVRRKVTNLQQYRPSNLSLNSIANDPNLLLELREQSIEKLENLAAASREVTIISPTKIEQLGTYGRLLNNYGYEVSVSGIVEDLSKRYLDRVELYAQELRTVVEQINEILGT